MTSPAEAAKACPIATIGTTLGRARCRQPARIERMKQSLATHGQLTPLVGTARPEGVELVDGFKRLAAATALKGSMLMARSPGARVQSKGEATRARAAFHDVSPPWAEMA